MNPSNPHAWLAGLVISCAIAMLPAGPALAQRGSALLGPALLDELQGVASDEPIGIIVELRERADLGAAAAARRRAAGRAEPVIRALQRSARSGQARLARRLQQHRNRGEIHRLRSRWIFNGYTMEATPGAIASLAASPDVERITLDQLAWVGPTVEGEAEIAADDYEWGVAKIGAPFVWELWGHRGAGVVVGIIDTGVFTGHPDLANFTGQWRDAVNGQLAPYDDNSHGTHVAGTAVGGSTGATHIGVAPDASYMACKAFTQTGSGLTSDILECMEWMADPDGNPATDDQPDIVSNSWSTGGGFCSDSYLQAIEAWWAVGIFPVFAAGNHGSSPGSGASPANYAAAHAVGSTNSDDVIASSSGRGPSACSGETFPDVSAPGVNIRSASPNGGYSVKSGTSMATPHVAGCVALIRSATDLEGLLGLPQSVWDWWLLENFAVDLGASGKDDVYGAGRINCLSSVYVGLLLDTIE